MNFVLDKSGTRLVMFDFSTEPGDKSIKKHQWKWEGRQTNK